MRRNARRERVGVSREDKDKDRGEGEGKGEGEGEEKKRNSWLTRIKYTAPQTNSPLLQNQQELSNRKKGGLTSAYADHTSWMK